MTLALTEDLEENLFDYFAALEMGGNKHLLVEGASDKKVFERLLDILSLETVTKHTVEIHLADNLAKELISGQNGNRNKVEYICKSASKDKQLSSQNIILAGFVDREFDKFNCDEKICDLLDNHYFEECLFWSRGHSIENYFFEKSIFIELFLDLLAPSWISQAVVIFKEAFDEVIRLACAVGLAAHKLKKSNFVRNYTNWEHLTIHGAKVTIDLQNWKNYLIQKGEPSSSVEELIEKYIFYSETLKNVDLKVVKWLCDGHLGLSFILFAFCCCLKRVYPSTSNSKEPKLTNLIGCVLQVKRDKFYLCANWWARKVREQKCAYPKELLVYLGIHNEGAGCLLEDTRFNGESC